MIRDFFQDDFSEIQQYSSNDTLYPFIDHGNEQECLKWLNNDIHDKMNRAQTRLERISQLIALFKGINWKPTDARNIKDTLGLQSIKPRDAKVFVNFINEMVEAKVSQRSRFKPSVVVLPNNDELSDEINAQTCKQILDCISQKMDFDSIFSNSDKIEFLEGESYTFVEWDKLAGGVAPKFKELQKKNIDIKRTDPMLGDVSIKVRGPGTCFPQLDKTDWENVDELSTIDFIHIDELKSLYPDKANKIFATDTDMTWDYANRTKMGLKNHCMVVTFYHKSTRFLPDGAYVKFINSTILEKSTLKQKYKHGKLPVVFNTDIDLNGELHGRPFTDNIARLQSLHNMVMASMAKGYAIACNPKWVAPKGSVAINKYTNDYGLMEFQGAIPPQLVTFSGIPKDSWDYSDKLERYIEKGSTVFGISRGEPPRGIKAAVALQFLDEQELQRESRGMAKRQKKILSTYSLLLETMAQYYTPEDGRIFNMLGSDNSYVIKYFNVKGISNYDVRFANSSSLPDSKTGKVATILDINMATQNDPYFGREEISTILDMGNDKRFANSLSVSVRAADTIISRILSGEKNLEPNEYDDFIVQYPIILRALQSRTFKDNEASIVDEFKTYILSMEYLMSEKAIISPSFASRLQNIYNFPIFYKPQIPMQVNASVQHMEQKQDMSKMADSTNNQLAEMQNQENKQ